MTGLLVRVALACWPPERRYRRRARTQIEDWATDRFLRVAATVTRIDDKLIDAANNNRRAAMRAALGRVPR